MATYALNPSPDTSTAPKLLLGDLLRTPQVGVGCRVLLLCHCFSLILLETDGAERDGAGRREPGGAERSKEDGSRLRRNTAADA